MRRKRIRSGAAVGHPVCLGSWPWRDTVPVDNGSFGRLRDSVGALQSQSCACGPVFAGVGKFRTGGTADGAGFLVFAKTQTALATNGHGKD